MAQTKKKRKVSAYHKRLGKGLKQGMTFRQAHRYAKSGKSSTKQRTKSKPKSSSKRSKAKTKVKTVGKRMARRKFPIFTGMALSIPVVGSALQVGLDQGDITKDKVIRFISAYSSSYFPIALTGEGKVVWHTEDLARGWGPLLGLSGIKMFKKLLNFRTPKESPVGFS